MISEKYLIREAIEAGLCLNDYERRLAEGWNSGERITYKVWANKEEKAAFMEKAETKNTQAISNSIG